MLTQKVKNVQEKLPQSNNKYMRKYLAKVDWNNMLGNKTAIECWNILKYKIESIINNFSLEFLMTEYLNGYFSSMFTREDISSLPV